MIAKILEFISERVEFWRKCWHDFLDRLFIDVVAPLECECEECECKKQARNQDQD